MNVNCVRDVLGAIEALHVYYIVENSKIAKREPSFYDVCNALPKWDPTEILYVLETLDQAGFVDATVEWFEGCADVPTFCTMTYKGHELLDSIREEW